MPDMAALSNRNGSTNLWTKFNFGVSFTQNAWNRIEHVDVQFHVFVYSHPMSLSRFIRMMCPICNAIYSLASYNTNTFQIISLSHSHSPIISCMVCVFLFLDTNLFSPEILNHTIISYEYGGRFIQNIFDVQKVLRVCTMYVLVQYVYVCNSIRFRWVTISIDELLDFC